VPVSSVAGPVAPSATDAVFSLGAEETRQQLPPLPVPGDLERPTVMLGRAGPAHSHGSGLSRTGLPISAHPASIPRPSLAG
jgi:hypothetical protein